MSGRRGKGVNSNNSTEMTFKEYRDLAPADVDDGKLRELIKLNNNDREKITVAIMNLWEDKGHRATDTEWVQTTKTKKSQKENEKPSSSHQDGGFDGRGRGSKGGRGEGRGGRGPYDSTNGGRGGGRGSKGYKSSKSEITPASPEPQAVPTPAPVPTSAPASESWSGNLNNQTSWDFSATSNDWKPPAAPETSSASAPSGIISWKGGMNLAEKLKRQDAEKQRQKELELKRLEEEKLSKANKAWEESNINTYPPAVEDIIPDEPESNVIASELVDAVVDLSISNDQYSPDIESDIADEAMLLSTQSVPLLSEPSPTNPSITVTGSISVTSSAEKEITDAYLKLGRWETSQQSATLQFGSFGKDVTDDVSQQSWSSAAIEGDNRTDSQTESWNTASSNVGSSTLSNSLFVQPAPKPVVSLSPEQSKFDQKPPGLGEPAKLVSNVSSNARPSAPNQSRVSKANTDTPVQSTLPAASYSTYSAPPGIPNSSQVGNSNARTGTNAATSAIPPAMTYYNPSYDQYASAYAGYPPVASIAPSTMNVGSASTAVPNAASGTSSQQQPQQQQQQQQQQQSLQQQQQQQQQYPPQYQYFPNPYFNQYYYQGQMPGFYNQRGGMYQPRPGGYADPYSPVYDMYSSGQPFPDASSYGAIPAVAQPVQSNSATAGAKTQKAATGVAPVAAPQAGMPDINSAAGYGAYGMSNPYAARDLQAWNYQQSPAGWGAPMMGYAASPSAQQGPASGFGQQGVMPGQPQQTLPQQQAQPVQQQTQGGGRDNSQRPSQVGGSYGGSFGGGRPNGSSAPGATGQASW